MALALERFSDAREHLMILLREDTPEDGALEQSLGLCDEGEKQYAEAAEWYRKAILHAPNQLESYVRLASLLRRQAEEADRANRQRLPEVVALFGCTAHGGFPSSCPWSVCYWPHPADQVINALVAANPRSFRAYLLRSRYRREHGTGDAAQDVARARALAPDEGDVLLASAELSLEGGDLDQARSCLELGTKKQTPDPRFYVARARLEQQLGRYEEATASLRRGLKILPHDPNLLWHLAEALARTGSREEVDNLRSRLRRAGFPGARLEYLTALQLVHKKEWADAARALEAARGRLDEGLRKQADLLLGQCYERLGDADAQLEAYRRAVDRDPSWLPARFRLGSALVAKGKLEEAYLEYRRLTLLPGAPAAAWRMLGLVQLILNRRLPKPERDWRELERTLDQAEAAAPGSIEVLMLRVEVLAGQQQFERARTLLEKARDQQPKRVELWVALSDLALFQGESAKALQIIDRTQKLLGDTAELRLARARYWARMAGPTGHKSIAELERGLGRFPADQQDRLRDGLADAYYRSGAPREAARLWRELADRQPKNVRIRLRLLDLGLQISDEAAVQRLVGELRGIEGEGGDLWRFADAALLVLKAKSRDKGLLREAGDHLAEVASRQPNWSRVALLRALIAEQLGQMELALGHYRHAIELGDRQPAVIRHAVEMLTREERYLEADQLVRRLGDPHLLEGDFGRMAVSNTLRLEDFDRALEWARKAVPLDSPDYKDHIWLGQLLWAADQPQQAEARFRHAVQLAGKAPDARVALVQYLARTRQTEKALAAIRDAERQLGQDSLALARCYEAVGREDLAEQHYEAALAAKPDDLAALRGTASFYMRAGRLAKARVSLERIKGLKKVAQEETSAARRQLAIIDLVGGNYQQFQKALQLIDANLRSLIRTGTDLRLKAIVLATRASSRQEAIAILEDLVLRQPTVPEDRFLLAQLYEATGAWSSARAQLVKLLASHPDNAAYLAYYLRGLLRHEETTRALEWLPRLEELKAEAFAPPESRDRLLVEIRAVLLQKRGQKVEAVETVREYAKTRGADLGLAARLFETLGDTEAAEKLFRQHATASQQPEPTLALVGFLRRRNRPQEALDVCEKALKRWPPERISNAAVGLLLQTKPDAGHYRRVERWLEAAAAKSPRNVSLLADLVFLRILQRRYPDAVALNRRILAEDSSNSGAMNNLAWLLAQHEGRGAEALKLVDRALELKGPEPTLLDTRAMVYLTLGQGDRALKDLEKVVEEAPTASRYFHLARAHWAVKQREAASEAMRIAMKRGLSTNNVDPLEQQAFVRLLRELGLRSS
jgi:tetratricopeptide (TPR) repeat protein